MKKLIGVLAIGWLIAAGCSKKPQQELTATTGEKPTAALTPADSAKQAKAKEDSIQQAKVAADKIEDTRLEGQRKVLEDLMNKLMGDEIYFEFDKAVLSDKAKELLAQAGDILQKEPKLWVLVEGHTDARGSEAYNMTLGGKRAQSVVDYLVAYGVTTDRLKTISYGAEKPKAEGKTEEAYAQNRRAVFQVQIKK